MSEMVLAALSLSVALAGSAMAAQQAAQDPALRLSKSLQDAAGHYAADTDQLRNATNRGTICSVLDEARQVGRALSRTLDQRRDTIAANELDLFAVGTSGTATNTAQQKETFDASVRTLSLALPGVFLPDGNAVRFGPDYTALGQLSSSIPEKKLLQSVGALLVSGSPVTFTTPAAAHCSNLTATTAAVQVIVKSWASSPRCLQDSLADSLNARLGEIAAARYEGGSGATFCETKDQAGVAATKLAELISSHAYLGGAMSADFLRQTIAAPTTKFGGGGAGGTSGVGADTK